MAKTKIEWCDRSWNVVTGCTKVSSGCANCYAERMAKRLAGRYGYPEKPNSFKVTLHEDKLWEPGTWKKPQRVFVCSMSDMFHLDVPVSFIDKMFQVMAETPQHTYLVLTKRPERMRTYFEQVEHVNLGVWMLPSRSVGILNRWPLPNVWVGTSVEDQKAAEERIPALLATPAAIHFVSCEPLLGHVDLTNIKENEDWTWDVLTGIHIKTAWSDSLAGCARLNWVIVGGESGPNARPMHPEWARSLRKQCREAGVPFLFKQWGEWTPEFPQNFSLAHTKMFYAEKETFYRVGKAKAGRRLDGEVWDEYPRSGQAIVETHPENSIGAGDLASLPKKERSDA